MISAADKILLEGVKKFSFAFFERSEEKSHNWEHALRVRENALQIGKKLNADLLVLELAAFLHDIARSEEMVSKGKIDHAKRGVELARGILEKLGTSEELIAAVCHCVENHRAKGASHGRSLEADILFDADKLDALGAVGILRLDRFALEVGAGLHNKTTDLENTETYTSEDTSFREFYMTTRFFRDKMRTAPGKIIAAKRHRFMILFFRRFFEEINADEAFCRMLKECE